MATRRRTAVPTYEEVRRQTQRTGQTAYDRDVLGSGPQVAGNQFGRAAQGRTERLDDPETNRAIDLAKDGDVTLLLPYRPTPSSCKPRPRTKAAGYDRDTMTLRVQFRNGRIYEYYNVPPRIWNNFKRVKSPGKFINRHLNAYPYAELDMRE